MSWYSLPVRRPVATSMLFAAIVLLGIVGLQKIPVELFPDLEGDQLNVTFMRQNSEPEVVEREILIPLEARASELPGMAESWGEVRGSRGSFRVRFEPDSDIKIRQLDLQRIAVELRRGQPEGTMITVATRDTSFISRFVMSVQVMGGADTNALRSLIDDRIQPRLSAVTGVGTVLVAGGAPEEVTVSIDPNRCAALGISPSSVGTSLTRSVQRLRFLGGLEDADSRTAVMLDGRPRGTHAIAETRVELDKPVLIRHVASVERGTGRRDMLFRINSKPSVGLIVFKEEGANLVELGRELRTRLHALGKEFRPYGVEFLIGFDGAETVEEQIDRLKKLGLSGFLIALVVLFLFIRQARAVSVVAVAVPVSLLAALAMLYVGGYSLNLITLFGLALGIGMLVDSSIVVLESIYRCREEGDGVIGAAIRGTREVRMAVVASTLTSIAVFLPMVFVEGVAGQAFGDLGVAVVISLLAALVVALFFIPMLASRQGFEILRLHPRCIGLNRVEQIQPHLDQIRNNRCDTSVAMIAGL